MYKARSNCSKPRTTKEEQEEEATTIRKQWLMLKVISVDAAIAAVFIRTGHTNGAEYICWWTTLFHFSPLRLWQGFH